jgi:hypothetical protein
MNCPAGCARQPYGIGSVSLRCCPPSDSSAVSWWSELRQLRNTAPPSMDYSLSTTVVLSPTNPHIARCWVQSQCAVLLRPGLRSTTSEG